MIDSGCRRVEPPTTGPSRAWHHLARGKEGIEGSFGRHVGTADLRRAKLAAVDRVSPLSLGHAYILWAEQPSAPF
ncbi:MAG: hypothetical protein DYH12_30440 [Sorangiineae bacterium PRO1]|nr:hypothetical protein [Sorangiineae bacterium PRO1]